MIVKKKFAAEIKDGDSFDDVFILGSIQRKIKKRGGEYWTLTLQDKTGFITGKLWDKPAEELPCPGDFVKVRCESSIHRDEVELNVKLIRVLAADLVDVEDFVPVGPRDRFQQVHELDEHVRSIKHNGLRAVCKWALEDEHVFVALRDAPAAKSHHHAYVGGLLDHVVGLCNLVRGVMQAYRRGGRWPADEGLAEDLLVAAAIWHDIGKTRELKWGKGLGYTPEGQMIGHVVVSLQILEETEGIFWEGTADGAAKNRTTVDVQRDERVWLHLRHIVASHHGRLEWGAAKAPMSREATLFHLLDMIDSRMGAFDQLDQEKVDDFGFGSWSKTTEGPFWRMT